MRFNHERFLDVKLLYFGVFFQKTNVLAGAINSACNPVFYYMYMPSFRRAVIRTVLPCVKKNDSETSTSNNTTETSTDNL